MRTAASVSVLILLVCSGFANVAELPGNAPGLEVSEWGEVYAFTCS